MLKHRYRVLARYSLLLGAGHLGHCKSSPEIKNSVNRNSLNLLSDKPEEISLSGKLGYLQYILIQWLCNPLPLSQKATCFFFLFTRSLANKRNTQQIIKTCTVHSKILYYSMIKEAVLCSLSRRLHHYARCSTSSVCIQPMSLRILSLYCWNLDKNV